MILECIRHDDGSIAGHAFYCPGCQHAHVFYSRMANGDPGWTFNGSETAPTFAPSLLNSWNEGPERTPKRCHLYVRNGEIEFLADCTHELAGKTVRMGEFQW